MGKTLHGGWGNSKMRKANTWLPLFPQNMLILIWIPFSSCLSSYRKKLSWSQLKSSLSEVASLRDQPCRDLSLKMRFSDFYLGKGLSVYAFDHCFCGCIGTRVMAFKKGPFWFCLLKRGNSEVCSLPRKFVWVTCCHERFYHLQYWRNNKMLLIDHLVIRSWRYGLLFNFYFSEVRKKAWDLKGVL